MRSSLFDHWLSRIFLGLLLVGCFWNVFLVVGFGSGTLGSLLLAGYRSYWIWAQIAGWIGIGFETLGLVTVRAAVWRKIASMALLCITISAAVFLIRSDDFKFANLRFVYFYLLVFGGAVVVRACQLRMKPKV